MKPKRKMKQEERKKVLLLESDGLEIKEMLSDARGGLRKVLKVAYTNADGLIGARWELEEYLKENTSDKIGRQKQS